MRLTSRVAKGVAALLLLSYAAAPADTGGDVSDTTLARLYFGGVAPEHARDLRRDYRRRLAPLLARHGLVAEGLDSNPKGRVFATIPVPSPTVVAAALAALQADSGWVAALRDLGARYHGPGLELDPELYTYRAPVRGGRPEPAGPGRTVVAGAGVEHPVGPGVDRGAWRNLGPASGVPREVHGILQDRHGDLWLATGLASRPLAGQGGLWRFDGAHLRRYGVEDGLPSPDVRAVVEAPAGGLWLATAAGLVRFRDGSFTVFTAADGLPAAAINCLLVDAQDQLWVGSEGGLSRYDGATFVTYTAADGVPRGFVRGLYQDRAGHLWLYGGWGSMGPYGLCRFDGRTFTTFHWADGLSSAWVLSLHEDDAGTLWVGTNNTVDRYDGVTFRRAFTTDERQFLGGVPDILQDRGGSLWFAIYGEGVRRVDGDTQQTFGVVDGLGTTSVGPLLEDRSGQLWVGHWGGGLSRYTGERLRTFTTADGLPHDRALALWEDTDGRLWVGTQGGPARRQGRGFRPPDLELPTKIPDALTKAVPHGLSDSRGGLWLALTGLGLGRGHDGRLELWFRLPYERYYDTVKPLLEDSEGRVWVTSTSPNGGMHTFDGRQWREVTLDLGLPSHEVRCMLEDRDGSLWFGGNGGVSRLAGGEVTHWAIGDSIDEDPVTDLLEDRHGTVWITSHSGVRRFDGDGLRRLTANDGLPFGSDEVTCALETRDGDLWFGTDGGGLCRYDGQVSQVLSRADGLASDGVFDLLQDEAGDIWIATDAGLNRYRPGNDPPSVTIASVTTHRRQAAPDSLRLTRRRGLVAFEVEGHSLTTPSARMQYLHRLAGIDSTWRVASAGRIEYADLPTGTYRFEVRAVDLDLNRSEVAALGVSVRPDYAAILLQVGLGTSLLGLVAVAVVAARRRRERDRAREQLLENHEQELQTARQMQRALMPSASPEVGGLQAAGRCLTMNHVGGDFYQFYPRDGQLAVCLADVTGHAMEAAIPVVMFSGILEHLMEQQPPLPELFGRLNRSLCRSLGRRRFVCFAMADVDAATGEAAVASCGCPHPLHYRAATGQVEEVEVGAYPLGVRASTEYEVHGLRIEPGDYLVLYSDGIPEALNDAGEVFSFERTVASVRRCCAEGRAPEDLLDQVYADLARFQAGTPQADDITCVVLRKTG